MCLTLLQQSGAPVFKQSIVPPGLVIHFYNCVCFGSTENAVPKSEGPKLF